MAEIYNLLSGIVQVPSASDLSGLSESQLRAPLWIQPSRGRNMCELLCVGVLNPAPPEARTERFKAPDVAWAIRGPGCPSGRLRRRFCGISRFVLFFCESFVPLAACEAGN